MPTAKLQNGDPAVQTPSHQTLPDESYKGQTYWADLHIGERTCWVWKQQVGSWFRACKVAPKNTHASTLRVQLAEERQELSTVWNIFKQVYTAATSSLFTEHNASSTGVNR